MVTGTYGSAKKLGSMVGICSHSSVNVDVSEMICPQKLDKELLGAFISYSPCRYIFIDVKDCMRQSLSLLSHEAVIAFVHGHDLIPVPP